MALNKLQKLAGVSAVALGVAVAASDSWSAAYDAGSGDPSTVTVTATVDNSIDVNISQMPVVGTIGVTNDSAEQATLVMATTGTITEDTTGNARMLHQTGTGTAGVVAITGAFANTQLSVDFGNPVDLTCGACAGTPPALTLMDATTDLPTPGDLATPTTASGTTDGAGALSFNIGITLQTPTSVTAYEDGTYSGSFDLFFGY